MRAREVLSKLLGKCRKMQVSAPSDVDGQGGGEAAGEGSPEVSKGYGRVSGDERSVLTGRWQRISPDGVSGEVLVAWDAAICRYLVNGIVWPQAAQLREYLAGMETGGVRCWVPARDENTLAVRRGLGLRELV